MKAKHILIYIVTVLFTVTTMQAQQLVLVQNDGLQHEFSLSQKPYILFDAAGVSVTADAQTVTVSYLDFNYFTYATTKQNPMGMVMKYTNGSASTYPLAEGEHVAMTTAKKESVFLDDIDYTPRYSDDPTSSIYTYNCYIDTVELDPSSPYYDVAPLHHYLDIQPQTNSAQPYVAFQVPWIGAGTYDIYLITLPLSIIEDIDEAEAQKNYMFRVNMFYRNADGTLPTNRSETLTNLADETSYFDISAQQANTIFLGIRTFDDMLFNPSMLIQLQSYVTYSMLSTHSRRMVIGGIILKAHDDGFTTSKYVEFPNGTAYNTDSLQRINCFDGLTFTCKTLSDNILSPQLQVTSDYIEGWYRSINFDAPIDNYNNHSIVIDPDSVGIIHIPFLLFPGYDYTYTPFDMYTQGEPTKFIINDDISSMLSVSAADDGTGMGAMFTVHVKGLDTFWKTNIKNNLQTGYSSVFDWLNTYSVSVRLTDKSTGEVVNTKPHSFSLPTISEYSGLTDDKAFTFETKYYDLNYGHSYDVQAVLSRYWSNSNNQENEQTCLSMNPTTLTVISEEQFNEALTANLLPSVMAKDPQISLFCKALFATHFNDSLMAWRDESYHCSSDSVENGRCYLAAAEYDNVFYPGTRWIGFTGFIETDDVLATNGINTLDDLRAYAKNVYDNMYPQDAAVTDETNPRNSLYRFVAYHFLPEKMNYNQLTVDNAMLSNFNRRQWDVADWYETMMPHSLMKISFPSGAQAGRYVNRRGVQSRPDARGVKIPGAKISYPTEEDTSHEATNGTYHYIDNIIDYGRQTQEVVLNERIRIDGSTLSPDFINSGARGHSVDGVGGSSLYPGQYGSASSSAYPTKNPNTCLGFKAGSVKNFKFDDSQTHLHVRNRYLTFWSYQGDEVLLTGMFDAAVKMPPLPEGSYELRLGLATGFNNRGIVQFYFDDEPCGLPRDLRPNGSDAFVGWKADDSNTEANVEYDHMMRLGGWMKGPASYIPGGNGGSMRTLSSCMRLIITTFYSDGKTDHYLRIQQRLPGSYYTIPLDYIELVPRSVYDNELYPEDIY